MANFAAADQAGLVRIIKRKLKKIQYRPHLINGCLAATGLESSPGDLNDTDEFNLVKAGNLHHLAGRHRLIGLTWRHALDRSMEPVASWEAQ